MPIRIPIELPAQDILLNENIFVMDSDAASKQDIRPLEVGILNLMPNKIQTEAQLCRLLSNTPLQINIDLIRFDNKNSQPSSAANKGHTPQTHLDTFYTPFSQVKNKRYDGLIITGAPLALLPYEEISYWDDITEVMTWAKQNVQSTLYLCWAAHAAMYFHYGVDRELRQNKLFGVFEHQVYEPLNELVRGFDATFKAPHSRFGQISTANYRRVESLQILAGSENTSAYLIASRDKRTVFLTGHPEYDVDTLQREYQRDLRNGKDTAIPENYFSDDDTTQAPLMSWRSHGALLFSNWLNYYVYQTTPYDLAELSAHSF